LKLIDFSQDKNRGETMSTQTIRAAKYPMLDQAQRTRDVLLVSSFGLWAAVIGLMPVMAFRMLTGS
jgi:hypothetical protein